MESLRRWSLGSLFREVPGRGNDLNFKYPSRLEAAGFVVLAGLGLLGEAFWLAIEPSRDPVTLLALGTVGLFVFLTAWTGFYRLWNQRVFVLSREDRQLTYTPADSVRDAAGGPGLRQARSSAGFLRPEINRR